MNIKKGNSISYALYPKFKAKVIKFGIEAAKKTDKDKIVFPADLLLKEFNLTLKDKIVSTFIAALIQDGLLTQHHYSFVENCFYLDLLKIRQTYNIK